MKVQQIRGRLAGLAALSGSILVIGASPGSAPREVKVIGNDYAFVGIPATVRQGLTYFSFRNEGKVRHEMILLQLDPGVTAESVMEKYKAGARGRELGGRTAGILIVVPQESSLGRLALELHRGEKYLVFCSFRDTPDAPRHFDMGMYGVFAVR